MAKASDNDEEMISGINVTPLVDITLVLLIVFMVTATYIVRESIEVDLPRAASGGESVGELFNVVLDKEGALYIDGVRADETQLMAKAKEAAAKDASARVVISADQNARHGAVVHLIDLVKSAGKTVTVTPDGLVIIADSEITDENDLGILYRALS